LPFGCDSRPKIKQTFSIILHSAVVYAYGLRRNVKVVIANFTDVEKRQSRKKEKLDFNFNASLSSINLSKALARELGMKYSASSMKMLLHNAAIIERFILTFGKLPNSHLNNTLFKELLFYGVKAVA